MKTVTLTEEEMELELYFEEKFHSWLRSGVTSVRQLRKKIKRELRNTRNPEYKRFMVKLSYDDALADHFVNQ